VLDLPEPHADGAPAGEEVGAELEDEVARHVGVTFVCRVGTAFGAHRLDSP
jgi:hypothetical protein